MKKKSIVMLAATVMTTASVAIGGTLAYLNAQDSLLNTFSMGGDGGDGEFSINLTEAVVDSSVNQDTGAGVWTIGDGRTGENQNYQYVTPGAVLPKDPTVENTGSYDMWTRIQVVLPNADVWAAANGIDFTEEGDAAQLAALVFTGTHEDFNVEAAYNAQTQELTVSYLYTDILSIGDTTPAAFTHVNVPTVFDQDDIQAIINDDGIMNLQVTAQSIQTYSGFATVEAAMTAYDNIAAPIAEEVPEVTA